MVKIRFAKPRRSLLSARAATLNRNE